VVSVFIHIIAQFSSYEKNQFNLLNSFWFTFGSLIRQSTVDIKPKSTSVKLISLTWSFFCLMLVSSYKANLAAFLTSNRLIEPIEMLNN